MRKFPINTKYLTISIYAIVVIFFAVLFDKTLGNLGDITTNINSFVKTVRSVFAPFIYGLFIAYFINPIVKFIETRAFTWFVQFFGKVKARVTGAKNGGHSDSQKKAEWPLHLPRWLKLKRFMAILITYVVLIGFMVWLIAYLIPEIYVNIRNLILFLQKFDFNAGFEPENGFMQFLNSINSTFGTNYSFAELINLIIEPVMASFQSIPSIINLVLASTAVITSGVFTIIIGIIIAFYLLYEKENIGRSAKKLMLTVFKNQNANRVIQISSSSNIVFQNFITGKALDSLIVGIIFFVTCIFLKPPYAVLLSVIIGVTNMIPYFGPFIGAAPVVLIVLLYDPMLAIWIALDILIIQQIDGYILGPKILGDSTGLKPLGVIFAIIAGGAIFGIFGMFLGVPLFAVMKNMGSEVINRVYNKKYAEPPGDGGTV